MAVAEIDSHSPQASGRRLARPLAGLIATCLLFTLSGCRLPDPVHVPFPDDARVLHGVWAIEVLDGAEILGFDRATVEVEAELRLDAHGRTGGYRIYDFFGTIDVRFGEEGDVTRMRIEGTVDGGDYQAYLPGGYGPRLQTSPPRLTEVSFEIRDELSGEVTHTGHAFNWPSPLSATYEGHSYVEGEPGYHQIRLSRPTL